MSVISIQSQVVFGHVGNSGALHPLMANGVNVHGVPTTLLSNAPVYSTLRGKILPPDFVEDLLIGVEERGLVEASQLLVTGYLGSEGNGRVVHDFLVRAKAANPGLVYVCDPVIGDTHLGIFVAAGLPDYFRRELAPLADILTPNAFEFGLLAGLAAHDADAVIAALRGGVPGLPRRMVVTGAIPGDAPGVIDTLLLEDGQLRRIRTPRVDVRTQGTGDLFTGALVAALAGGMTLTQAAEQAVASVYEVLVAMPAGEAGELPLAAKVDVLRWQPRPFRAERV